MPLNRTLWTAFDLLSQLEKGQGRGLTLSELADALRLHKSTVHRLLGSLEEGRYVDRSEETGRYRLGLRLLELGSVVLESLDLRQEARPILEALGREAGETVHLCILEQGEVVYIDKVETTEPVRMYSRIGRRAPVYCTAVGKAMLAHLPTEEQDHLIREINFRRLTENTLNSVEALREQLVQIRRQGCSFDQEEHELGVRCVAAPIFDHTGRAVAAVSITGPTTRMTPERATELAPAVRSAAAQISGRLAYRADRATEA